MAIGVVTRDALAQPQNLGHAQERFEVLLDGCPIQPRISVRVEQACFGSQQGTQAVDVYGSTLHHYPGMEHRHAELVAHPGWNDVIEVVGRILPSPGIEIPVDNCLEEAAVLL